MSDRSHSVRGVLRWAGAPESVLAWAGAEPLADRDVGEIAGDARPLLDRTPGPSALLWTLAVLGEHADVIATSVGLMLEARAEKYAEPKLEETLKRSLDTLVDAELGQGTLLLGRTCDLLAETGRAKNEGHYRDTESPFPRLCRAVAAFARAAEAIGGHGARMEAERMDSARKTAGILAIGVSAMVAHQKVIPPTLARPLATHLDPPHELVYAVEQLSAVFAQLEAHERPLALRDELLGHLEDE